MCEQAVHCDIDTWNIPVLQDIIWGWFAKQTSLV